MNICKKMKNSENDFFLEKKSGAFWGAGRNFFFFLTWIPEKNVLKLSPRKQFVNRL